MRNSPTRMTTGSLVAAGLAATPCPSSPAHFGAASAASVSSLDGGVRLGHSNDLDALLAAAIDDMEAVVLKVNGNTNITYSTGNLRFCWDDALPLAVDRSAAYCVDNACRKPIMQVCADVFPTANIDLLKRNMAKFPQTPRSTLLSGTEGAECVYKDCRLANLSNCSFVLNSFFCFFGFTNNLLV